MSWYTMFSVISTPSSKRRGTMLSLSTLSWLTYSFHLFLLLFSPLSFLLFILCSLIPHHFFLFPFPALSAPCVLPPPSPSPSPSPYLLLFLLLSLLLFMLLFLFRLFSLLSTSSPFLPFSRATSMQWRMCRECVCRRRSE